MLLSTAMSTVPLVALLLGLLRPVSIPQGGALELAPEVLERRAAALASEKTEHAAALAKLSPDWSHFETEHFLVLSHTEEKTARRVADQGAALLEYLAEELAVLGREEYVRRPILHVCKNSEERRSFSKSREGTVTWLPRSLEIFACMDGRGIDGYEFGYLNVALLKHFLKERASEVYLAMPPWLMSGLSSYLEALRVDKYGKIEFLRDDWDRDELTVQTQLGRGFPPRDLFRMTEKQFGTAATRSRYVQSDALVRYLFSEECAKSTRTKGLISSYLRSLVEHVAEKREQIAEAAEGLRQQAEAEAAAAATSTDAANPAEPSTDFDPAETKAQWRRKAWLEAEEALIEDLFFRTFRSFEEKDWKSFEKAFTKYID